MEELSIKPGSSIFFIVQFFRIFVPDSIAEFVYIRVISLSI